MVLCATYDLYIHRLGLYRPIQIDPAATNQTYQVYPFTLVWSQRKRYRVPELRYKQCCSYISKFNFF